MEVAVSLPSTSYRSLWNSGLYLFRCVGVPLDMTSWASTTPPPTVVWPPEQETMREPHSSKVATPCQISMGSRCAFVTGLSMLSTRLDARTFPGPICVSRLPCFCLGLLYSPCGAGSGWDGRDSPNVAPPVERAETAPWREPLWELLIGWEGSPATAPISPTTHATERGTCPRSSLGRGADPNATGD